MKSVGEVMAIGSNFQESLQKALCSMEEDLNGLDSILVENFYDSDDEILHELTFPGPKRLFYVADAIRAGWMLDKIHKLTKIDYWFLNQIEEILKLEKDLESKTLKNVTSEDIYLLSLIHI